MCGPRPFIGSSLVLLLSGRWGKQRPVRQNKRPIIEEVIKETAQKQEDFNQKWLHSKVNEKVQIAKVAQDEWNQVYGKWTKQHAEETDQQTLKQLGHISIRIDLVSLK